MQQTKNRFKFNSQKKIVFKSIVPNCFLKQAKAIC